MKRITLGLLTALLVACSSGGGPRPQPPPSLATLAVVVTSNGQAIEGAAFDVSALPAVPDGHTNADGYAAVVVPKNLVFAAQVIADGYLPWWAEVSLSGNLELPIELQRDGPPPPPPHPGPLVGRLHLGGDCFRDDTGCVNPIYAHAGDLFSVYVRDPSRALRELDEVAGAGFHGVRVWSTLGCEGGACHNPGDYWYGREVGPQVTPDYWDQVHRFLEAVKARQLRVVWSQGDVRALGDRREAMSRFAAIGNAIGDVIDFIDCGNEAYQTGEPDPRKLAECIGYYASAGGQALKSTTDAPIYWGGETWEKWVIPPSDVFDIHSYRGDHSWDKRRHAWGYTYENPPPLRYGISSEPPGNGWRVSAIANQHELDDEAVALLALGSLLGRQAHVWFSGQGVILEGGLNQEAGFSSTPRAVALLPNDVMTYQESHHSGDRFASIRVLQPAGEVRIDGRRHHDGRFAYTIDGPGGSHRLRVTRSFDARLCDPGTGECEDVSKNAGDTLDVSFTRGRLLVGRTR